MGPRQAPTLLPGLSIHILISKKNLIEICFFLIFQNFLTVIAPHHPRELMLKVFEPGGHVMLKLPFISVSTR